MIHGLASLIVTFASLTLASQSPTTAPATQPAVESQSVQGIVLEIAYAYEDGGRYLWQGSGVPEAISHKGEVILEKGMVDGEPATFCCGFTLAVGVKTARQLGLLEDKSVEDLKAFHRDWYGMDAKPGDPLISTAVENLGIGRAVSPEEARKGDFLQFWRSSGSGHSVIFLEWLEEDGQRVGVRYRSSNTSTDGIGDAEERFIEAGGKVDPEQLYFARIHPRPLPEAGEGAEQGE